MKYQGKAPKFILLWFVNNIFAVLTLFLYRPWAKCSIRKYLISHISVAGETLVYHANGKEIFKIYAFFSFLLTILLLLYFSISFEEANSSEYDQYGIYVILLMLFALLLLFRNIIITIVSFYSKFIGYIIIIGIILFFLSFFSQIFWLVFIAFALLIFVIFPMGYIYYFKSFLHSKMLLYQASRISWCSIRFFLDLDVQKFCELKLKRFAKNLYSCGLAIGVSDAMIARHFFNNLSYGSEKFNLDVSNASFDAANKFTLFLALPTLGISRIYYKYFKLKNCLLHLSLANLSFTVRFSFLRYLFFFITNWLLLIVSLGLAYPLFIHRKIKFFTNHVALLGNLEGFILEHSEGPASVTGEAFDQVISSDIGV